MIQPPKSIYLPGLNGLRAIAAISVLISHISLALPDFGLPEVGGWTFAGNGVTIFFTLSGFLITFLLLNEQEKKTIRIGKFYMRRILRIWPLYYTYLILSVICLSVFFEFSVNSLWPYFLLCINLFGAFTGTLVLVTHLWSIAVEENFYLFWPLLVKKNNLKRNTLLIIVILISLKFVSRYILKSFSFSAFLDTNRFECMLIGALGAILYWESNKLFLNLLETKLAQIISWLFLLIIALGYGNTPGPTESIFTSLVTLSLIVGQISNKGIGIVNLEVRLFDFLGKISYGIYVIHPLIIFGLSRLLINFETGQLIKIVVVYFLVIFSTVLFAHISYNYYEKPFLRLKKKYTVIKSRNSLIENL